MDNQNTYYILAGIIIIIVALSLYLKKNNKNVEAFTFQPHVLNFREDPYEYILAKPHQVVFPLKNILQRDLQDKYQLMRILQQIGQEKKMKRWNQYLAYKDDLRKYTLEKNRINAFLNQSPSQCLT